MARRKCQSINLLHRLLIFTWTQIKWYWPFATHRYESLGISKGVASYATNPLCCLCSPSLSLSLSISDDLKCYLIGANTRPQQTMDGTLVWISFFFSCFVFQQKTDIVATYVFEIMAFWLKIGKIVRNQPIAGCVCVCIMVTNDCWYDALLFLITRSIQQ